LPNLHAGLMIIALLVWLLKAHDHSFWMPRASIFNVTKLADIIGNLVHKLYLHKAEICFLNTMLWNIGLHLLFFIINVMSLCSCRTIIPSWVNHSYFLFVQRKLHFQGFCIQVAILTSAILTETSLCWWMLLRYFCS
jgi:hypothetical protein